jgi:hypothetical protein
MFARSSASTVIAVFTSRNADASSATPDIVAPAPVAPARRPHHHPPRFATQKNDIRELQNVIERAVILCADGCMMDSEHLSLHPPSRPNSSVMPFAELEKLHILKTLDHTHLIPVVQAPSLSHSSQNN